MYYFDLNPDDYRVTKQVQTLDYISD